MTVPRSKTAPRILIAEDDRAFQHELGVFLGRHGYAVICVEDGYQAVDFSLRDSPDLLVLDVHMPAGDGFSVHERIQRHPELALVPVIYMTHDHSRKIAEEVERHGAAGFLYKPFELDELLSLVRSALAHTDAEAA